MIISENKIYIPHTTSAIGFTSYLVNAIVAELSMHGVFLSDQLANAMSHLENQHIVALGQLLVKKYTVGNITRPLFEDWTMNSTAGLEHHRVAGMYSWGNNPQEFHSSDFRQKLAVQTPKDHWAQRTLTLATKEEAGNYLQMLLTGAATKRTFEFEYNMVIATKYFPEAFEGYIKNHFVRAFLAGKEGITAYDNMQLQIQDAMRIYAVKKDFDYWNLNPDTQFVNLSNKERNAVMAFLSKKDTEKLSEAFGKDRRLWQRFFKHIHVVGQRPYDQRYPELLAIIQASLGYNINAFKKKAKVVAQEKIAEMEFDLTKTGKVKYRTVASRYKTAVANKDADALMRLINKDPMYFFRNLNECTYGLVPEFANSFAEKAVVPVMHRIQPKTLIDVALLNTNATAKIMDVKGQTIIKEVSYSPGFVAVQQAVRGYLANRVHTAFLPESVELCGKIPLCLADTYSTITRGEVVGKVNRTNGENFLHVYVNWTQKPNVGNIDVDLSLLVVYRSGRRDMISWQGYSNHFCNHSGDVRSAPWGATEYISIDMNNPAFDGVDYIAPVSIVFTGSANYTACSEAFLGFKQGSSREFTMRLSDNDYKMDVTGKEAKTVVPFLIDVSKGNVVVLDYQMPGKDSVVGSMVDDINVLRNAVNTTHYPNVGTLCQLFYPQYPSPDRALPVVEVTKENYHEVFAKVLKDLS